MKHTRSITTFLLLGLAFAVMACNRHKLPPVIRLNAPDTVYTRLGAAFSFPEAIAFDREDHDLTSQIAITGTVNVDSIGYYPITYTVTNSDGEVGRADLVVRVAHGIDAYVGMFNSTNNCPACPNSGSTPIDTINQVGPPFIVIRAPMGTGIAWGYSLSFEITYDGITSYRGGQLPCFYDIEDATMRISDNADTIAVKQRLRARSGSLVNCESVYVRQ